MLTVVLNELHYMTDATRIEVLVKFGLPFHCDAVVFMMSQTTHVTCVYAVLILIVFFTQAAS